MDKHCKVCKEIKDYRFFGKNKNQNDGLNALCKKCANRRSSLWRSNNLEKYKKYRAAWYLENPNYTLNHYCKNKEKIDNQRNEQKRKKLKTDPVFKLRKNLRARLKVALRGNYKTGSAIRDLGCSVEFLKQYLESKFTPGMTWENYGKRGWHIDHVTALAKFDILNPDELKKAVHYTNLQPLWAIDNLRKGSK
jgi:hypothetical protein